MSEIQIKLIEKDTVIPKIKPYDWDVVVGNRPFYVARIPGYVHTIRGYGEGIDLWCWPRDEEPSYENLIEYELDSPVAWGLNYTESSHVKCKWGETMLRGGAGTTITRNGDKFYYVGGDKGYSIHKAITLIARINEHPLEFNAIDFDKKMIGRKIWYRSQPGVIQRYIKGQCCIMVEPDGMEYFSLPVEYAHDDLFGDWYDDRRLKLDCLEDGNICWFRQ